MKYKLTNIETLESYDFPTLQEAYKFINTNTKKGGIRMKNINETLLKFIDVLRRADYITDEALNKEEAKLAKEIFKDFLNYCLQENIINEWSPENLDILLKKLTIKEA